MHITRKSARKRAGQSIGRTGVVQHHIHTGRAPPKRQPARRIPFHDREELNAIIEDLLNQEIVRPSTSPYAAPVTLVKKKDGSLRLCIYYRDLNAQTIKDAFPLPRMDEIRTQLDGKKYFATLDLASSYW